MRGAGSSRPGAAVAAMPWHGVTQTHAITCARVPVCAPVEVLPHMRVPAVLAERQLLIRVLGEAGAGAGAGAGAAHVRPIHRHIWTARGPCIGTFGLCGKQALLVRGYRPVAASFPGWVSQPTAGPRAAAAVAGWPPHARTECAGLSCAAHLDPFVSRGHAGRVGALHELLLWRRWRRGCVLRVSGEVPGWWPNAGTFGCQRSLCRAAARPAMHTGLRRCGSDDPPHRPAGPSPPRPRTCTYTGCLRPSSMPTSERPVPPLPKRITKYLRAQAGSQTGGGAQTS